MEWGNNRIEGKRECKEGMDRKKKQRNKESLEKKE